ncbi:MAG TPA: hypothetical protein VK776_20145 [Bryobacteraceae bacterium]|nr:hypothetical protein [Bryobacteraceae bacterium]
MKRLDLKNCIVTIPDKDAAQAVVLYGGLKGWQGEWFLKFNKIPALMLQNVYFILPRLFTNKCKDCLDEFRSKVDPKNISRYSLCGFSRGAQEVYRNKDLEQWKILGLIDPSAPTLDIFKEDVLDNYVDKIRCVFWVPNWGKDGYKGRVPSFAQHLRDLKVKMVEKDVEHENMPPFFFNQYGAEFTV